MSNMATVNWKGTSVHHPLSAIRYPLPRAIRYPLLAACTLAILACSPKGEALYARAEKSLNAGELNAAIIDLKNLVKDEPENSKARTLLAAAFVKNGEIPNAAIEIQKARDLGATPEQTIVVDCSVMAARNEFTQVLEKCSPDTAPAGGKAALQVATGRALLGLERPAEAKPLFEAALVAEPNNLDALLGVGSATYVLEGLPAAQAVMEKASPDIQKKPAYWMAMGGVSSEGRDFAGAEQAFQKALDLVGPGSKGLERLLALGALAEAQIRQGKVKEATASAEALSKAAPKNPLVKQLRGQIAAAGGNLDEARTLLEDAVAEMPDNSQARLLLGVVNLQQGNTGQAEMHFQAVLAKEPNNARAQKLLIEARSKFQTPEQALASLKPSLDDANADPSLLAMAGRMSLASGDREQAMAYFTQAAAGTSDKTPADTQLELANGYLMAGDLDRALEVLEQMPAGGAMEFQRDYLLLATLLRKGENDKAVAEAKALVERKGSDPQVRNLAAAVYAAAGRKDEARQQFAEALKLKPDDQPTLLNLARFDLVDGRPAEAEKGFLKVLEGDPKNMIATVGLAVAANAKGDRKDAEKWLQKASTDHPDSVEAQIALAQFYMGTREFEKAKAVVDQAVKTAPDNAALTNVRGLTQMGLNDVPGAITSFKQATTLAPKSYGYALNLARAHLATRDLDAALRVLDGVIRTEPKYSPALALAGAATLQAGQVEKAAGYIERLRQAAPDAPATHMLEGDLAMAQKRYRDALADYRKAGEKGLNSQLVVAQYRAASLAGEPKPEAVLEDWIARNPGDANVASVLADQWQRAGNNEGAIKLYEQGLAKSPDNVVMLNNLAVLYDTKGDARAVEYAERAYKASPKAPAIADTYGWILFKRGKTDEGLKLLREAAKGLPNNAEVQYHLGAALAKKGDKGEATDLVKKALAGDLPADQKADAQKLLEQLTK